MKKNYILFLVCIVALAIVTLIGACTVTRTYEHPPGSGVLTNEVAVDPRFTNAVGTIGAVNEATAGINPWHGLITILLGGATAVAEWNRRRKAAQLNVVIAGVEAIGGEAVKKMIYEKAVDAGVEPALNKSVKAVTGG